MGMTIEQIIKDCEQSIKQSELFIKAHQANMEIGEIKEYQYYIERDKLTIDIMRKYQQIEEILDDCDLEAWEVLEKVKEVVADGNNDN
jgi:hypothetical protein